MSDFSEKTVLIVDDEPQIATLLQRVFESELNVKTVVCSNGMEGFQSLNTGKFDLICTDLKMPVMDGAALIKAVRDSDEPFKDIGIIVISGFTSDLDQCCMDYENIFLMDKPIDVDKLTRKASLLLKTQSL